MRLVFVRSLLLCLALVVNADDSGGGGGGSGSNDGDNKSNSKSDHRKPLNVSYLTSIKGRETNRQGLIISGAITYALDVVNNGTLLPNYKLNLLHNDSMGDTVIGTKYLTEHWRDNAVAFFGPEDSCFVEATIAAAWNLPMISYKCADHEVSNKERFPTFARTYPPDTQITKSVITLLKYYKWNKFSIIYEDTPNMETVADSLAKLAINHSIHINHKLRFTKLALCCEDGKPCCKKQPLSSIVDQTYKNTRIYVFLSHPTDLVYFMMTLRLKGLLDSGKYMVIYADIEPLEEKQVYRYVWHSEHTIDKIDIEGNLEAARSLLVVVTNPTTNEKYEQFKQNVSRYNTRPPFNFSDTMPNNRAKYITIYAAHLYDSVQLYAKALNAVLAENGSLTDGTAIIKKIISMGRYESIRGVDIYIDKNGDAEGNYSVLGLVNEADPLKHIAFKNQRFSRIFGKIGTFEYVEEGILPKFVKDTSVNFTGRIPAVAEPPCGYNGSLCIPASDYTREITSGTLVSVLFILSLAFVILFKNRKYEQEIAGLLWKVDLDELKMNEDTEGGIRCSASKATLTSGHSSLESRSCYPSYAPTASYRGVMVVIKHWKCSKKTVELTRDVMKEMRTMRTFHHHNVNTFLGACIQSGSIYILTEYCSRGSLPDILENDDLKLDSMFIASLIFDLIKGMMYIHGSELKLHGNLRASNCVVSSRWVLQVSDFGLQELRKQTVQEYTGEDQYYFRLLYTPPEFLRNPALQGKGAQAGDVYAFGIILHEIIERKGVYGDINLSSKEIVEKVADNSGEKIFRPNTYGLECQNFIVDGMKRCWAEVPEDRPTFIEIRSSLKHIREGIKKSNIFDHMMSMMEKYANNLKDLVDERTAQLVEEKKKTEALLHRMLPQPVAAQLMKGESVAPESFENVTIYFSDIVGFTEMSAQSTPLEVVNFLNDLYTLFDAIIRNYDVYKVETIGDAYMVVSGLPIRNGDLHAGEIASMALELLNSICSFKVRHRPDLQLKLRIGIHTGPVVAGVVGITMPRYCLFGDTVNTASRMESTGEPLNIHISQQCREHLDKLTGYNIVERGKMKIKGKGEMVTSWLKGQTPEQAQMRYSNIRETIPHPCFRRLPDGDCRRRSPKMGMESRSLSLLGRRNSSIPRISESDSNGPAGLPPFLMLNNLGAPSSSPTTTDSPRRRRRSPGRSRSYSIDKDSVLALTTPQVLVDGTVQSECASPERKRDSREVMFEGISDDPPDEMQNHSTGNKLVKTIDSDSKQTPNKLGKEQSQLTNGCVSPSHLCDNEGESFETHEKQHDDVVSPLLHPHSANEKNSSRFKPNHLLRREETSKRWRSCDEIEPKPPPLASFREWCMDWFSGVDSGRGNNTETKGHNHLMIREHDSESVV